MKPGKATDAFFLAIKEKSALSQARNQSTQNRQTRIAKQVEAHKKAQKDFMDRHLAGTINSLLALPAKNGRAFRILKDWYSLLNPENPKLSIILEYGGGTVKQNPFEAGGRQGSPYRYDRVHLIMDDYIDDDRFILRVCRSDCYDPRDKTKHQEITVMCSPEDVCAEIGKWFFAVAADRAPEMEKAAAAKTGTGDIRISPA